MNYTTQDIILLKYSFHLNNTSDVTMWQVVLIWFPFWENDLCLAPGLRMPVAFHLSELTLLSRGFHQFLILSQKKSYIRSHNQSKICRPLSDTVLSGFGFCQFVLTDVDRPSLRSVTFCFKKFIKLASGHVNFISGSQNSDSWSYISGQRSCLHFSIL